MIRIDAHQHFWRLDRGDYGWLTPDLQPIHRDFLPGDLAPYLARHSIRRTILVQAAPSEAETGFLLDIAAETPFVAGVVGWAAFDAPDAVDRIARLADTPWLKGLRPMIQDIADDRWMLRDELTPAFRAMVRHGLRFDALIKPRHLPVLRTLVDRHPDLPLVIDHGAKPDIARERFHDWSEMIRAVARETGAFCKLSGLVTEAAPGWSDEDILPYMDVLLEAFGADRLMWGSDWPVLRLNGDYDNWLACCDRWMAPLSPAERNAIRGGNAARFYGIAA